MPRMKLTDAAVQRLKPPDKGQVDYWDELQPGFGLRISFGGSKTWLCQRRILKEGAWKQTRITLGRYPAMTLAEARERARLTMQQVSEGKDPRGMARRDKAAMEEASRQTFKIVGELFMRQWVKRMKRRSSTEKEYRRALFGPDVTDWQDRPVSSFTRAEIRAKLEEVVDRAPYQSNRLRAYLRRFFGWCWENDRIEIDPTAGIKPLAAEVSRDRVLSAEEIVALLVALEEAETVMAPVFKLLLLTGQRREEIVSLRWSEVKDLEGDDPRIELPEKRTKNHRKHIVPLAPQAVAILAKQPRIRNREDGGLSDFVFTVTGNTAVSGISKAKRMVDGGMADALGQKLEPWRIHDLRRTVTTHMNEKLGIEPHIVEAAVNHISGPAKAGVAGTYNRAKYLLKRRAALTAWANHLDTLAGKAVPENVVALQRKGG
jgi:integrase